MYICIDLYYIVSASHVANVYHVITFLPRQHVQLADVAVPTLTRQHVGCPTVTSVCQRGVISTTSPFYNNHGITHCVNALLSVFYPIRFKGL